MVISPPFLPACTGTDEEFLTAAILLPTDTAPGSGGAPLGSFPLTTALTWQNGLHNRAPTVGDDRLHGRLKKAPRAALFDLIHPLDNAAGDARAGDIQEILAAFIKMQQTDIRRAGLCGGNPTGSRYRVLKRHARAARPIASGADGQIAVDHRHAAGITFVQRGQGVHQCVICTITANRDHAC